MVDIQIETPIHKVSSEFVARATELIIKITEQYDKCCPKCQDLIRDILKI